MTILMPTGLTPVTTIPEDAQVSFSVLPETDLGATLETLNLLGVLQLRQGDDALEPAGRYQLWRVEHYLRGKLAAYLTMADKPTREYRCFVQDGHLVWADISKPMMWKPNNQLQERAL